MILLCCDGAAWHRSKELNIPENIVLFHIPPYTPEMNPIEQIWKEIRKRGFRNPYCLEIDTLREPPMFQVSETHFAKTWLLDPRAPKVEKPETIQNIHEKLVEAFNI